MRPNTSMLNLYKMVWEKVIGLTPIIDLNLDSVDDVPGYLSDFVGQKNYIINSENSFDWLSQNPHLQTSVFCAIN